MTAQAKDKSRILAESLRTRRTQAPREPPAVTEPSRQLAAPELEIAPNDPIVAYFASASGVVEIDKLDLDSPALRAMKAADIKVVVPLVSQGELIGLLNLGPRLSQQEYSADDRKLLNDLATQTAPAVQVAQLVRQQQQQAQERERIEQELRVARLIQQTLLPKHVPDLPGYQLAAYYQPAREVGGDFYDFLELDDGHLGLVVGDVTDKGVPAAIVMATTRTMLRASAQRLDSPGEVLKRVNDVIVRDIPPNMFITCLYAILDPETGLLRFANAGHDLPYRTRRGPSSGGAEELRATGMPLGLLPGMSYEEKEIVLERGDSVLFYSDGLVEAHDPEREMFGFPRLQGLVGAHRPDGAAMVELPARRAGALYRRRMGTRGRHHPSHTGEIGDGMTDPKPARTDANLRRTLAEFSVPSEPGNERRTMEVVADVIKDMGLEGQRLERLKTAVAEATMNAMEHGNNYRAELPVIIEVLSLGHAASVRSPTRGAGRRPSDTETPDLEAKLEGMQTPRGWGLFLIKNMVDDMDVTGDEHHHTVELILHLEGQAEGGT